MLSLKNAIRVSRIHMFRNSSVTSLTVMRLDLPLHSHVSFTLARNLCNDVSLLNLKSMLNSTIEKFNCTPEVIGQRCKVVTDYQAKIVDKFISSQSTATEEEWDALIKDVLDLKFGLYKDFNIDAKIVASCIPAKRLDLAKSYLSYLKSRKRALNAAVVGLFLKVCFVCKESLTDHDMQRVSQFTEYLLKKFSSYGIDYCDGVIHGLVLLCKLEEALDLLNKSENMSPIKIESFSTTFVGFLENKDFDQTKLLLSDALKIGYPLSDDSHCKLIDICRDDRKKLDEVMSIYDFYNFKPHQLICNHIAAAYQDLPASTKLELQLGTIDSEEHCSACGDEMMTFDFSDGEFAILRDSILKVIVGHDIFKNTTPTELRSFITFITAEDPFDVIIDGLNVAFFSGNKLPPKMYVKTLEHVFTHFLNENKKILLVGRLHMLKWTGLLPLMKNMRVKHFFTAGYEDDLFMLYAALHSGAKCNFITRDMMRSQKFQLESSKLIALYNRWHMSHQLNLISISPGGHVSLKKPVTVRMSVHQNKSGGWHIPYPDNDSDVNNEYNIYKKWICLRPCIS